MIVGFDFDRVLFQTEKFKEHLFRNIDGFNETYSEAVDENNVYRPRKHAEILDVSMEEFWHAVEYADQCLYEDVDKLDQLPDDLRAVIVSRGSQRFQTEKIKKSGILNYVDEFIVVQDRAKDEATGIDFLVDDASIELERTSLPKERLIHFKRSEEDLQDVIDKLKQTERR